MYFLEGTTGKVAAVVLLAVLLFALGYDASYIVWKATFAIASLVVALLIILYAFSSRKSATTAWGYLFIAHLFILSGIIINMEQVNWEQIIMYASGVTIAGIVGYFCLSKIYTIDKDINLNQFHGYAYEEKSTAILFLLSAIGLLGFPITAAFIGIDVLFTHIHADQIALIVLTALCFLFIELAAIRIYCRIFLGLHKKLNHPVAFRSS
jgi:NADH:ubiquinone oxidoreductase subunit 2 (subunit N)